MCSFSTVTGSKTFGCIGTRLEFLLILSGRLNGLRRRFASVYLSHVAFCPSSGLHLCSRHTNIWSFALVRKTSPSLLPFPFDTMRTSTGRMILSPFAYRTITGYYNRKCVLFQKPFVTSHIHRSMVQVEWFFFPPSLCLVLSFDQLESLHGCGRDDSCSCPFALTVLYFDPPDRNWPFSLWLYS